MRLQIKLKNRKLGILYKRARFKVLYGGRGSGKSWGFVEALVYYARKYFVRILCAREFQSSISASVHQLIIDTIVRYNLESEFVITEKKITHRITGSFFIFYGIKTDPAKVKSTEGIDICYVEEAEKISQESLDILIPTIRKHGSEIWFAFNPQLPTDPISQMFLEKEVPPDTLIEKINYNENPYCTQETINDAEHMKATDPLRYEHVYMGGYNSQTSNKLFSFELIKQAINRVHDAPKGAVKAGFDVAREGDDYCVLTILQGQKVKKIVEWEHSKDSMKIAKKVVAVLHQYFVTDLAVDSVGVGGPVADRIRELMPKLHVVDYKSNHKPKPKNEDLYTDRRSESYHELMEWMQTGCIPENSELIRDLVSIEFKHDKNDRLYILSKEKIKKDLKRSTDWADSLAMAVNCPHKKIINHKTSVDKSWV